MINSLKDVLKSCKPFMWLYGKLRGAIELASITRMIKNNKKDAFLVMTPRHGNLGDHAIAYAEQKLLKKKHITFCEIDDYNLRLLKKSNMLDLMNGKTIIINGGGNLGTLWWNVEEMIRDIIKANPKSSIIIMPSTVFYADNDLLLKSAEIYNSHKDLTVYTREKYSFDMIKNLYTNVILAPDMVMSLKVKSQKERSGCLVCMRSDREKTITDNDMLTVIKAVTTVYGSDFIFTDTVLKEAVNSNNRKQILSKKFNEFSLHKVVITDRLHGMIFAAITGTPCIVVGSMSHKLQGCYEWIKGLDYIYYLGDVSLERLIDVLQKTNTSTIYTYNKDDIMGYFDEMGVYIKGKTI